MKRSLILVGGGGHCKSVIEAAVEAGYKIGGILEVPSLLGTDVLDYKVTGTDDDIATLAADHDFIITVGSISDCTLRHRLADKIKKAGGHLATVIAPTATVSRFATVAPGSVILHHATINAEASIGRNCIINTGAIIEHECSIGDFTHVSTAAVVNGDSHIGQNCFIGSNSVVINGISVTNNTVIGAGSVVISSIPQPGTYVGNPAQKIK